jgi:hypothetical protein
MHLFDTTEEIGHTQRQFWIVFGLVSGVTYVLAIIALFSVDQRRNQTRKLPEFFSRWVQGRVGSPEPDSSNKEKKA